MIDLVREAAITAYGLLWRDMETSSPLKIAARRTLFDALSNGERKCGIMRAINEHGPVSDAEIAASVSHREESGS